MGGGGGFQHIFDKDAVARCRVADHHVGDGADNLAVLDDRATAHERGQVGTAFFHKKFIFATIKCSFVENNMYLCSKFSI